MFTIEQILAAHAKVKTGVDFPAYIREIKSLGIKRYETFVADGYTDFSGSGKTLTSPGKYKLLAVSEFSDAGRFRKDLKAHQDGLSDYQEFCTACARSGVWKWRCDLEKMTCTYLDKAGTIPLVESIPS